MLYFNVLLISAMPWETMFESIYVITIPKRAAQASALIDKLNATNAHIFNATLPYQLSYHRPTHNVRHRLAATNSHIRALCAITAANSSKPSLILEDDAVPSVPLAVMPNIVHDALAALPHDWDVLYLSRIHAICEWDANLKGAIKQDSGAHGTQAYVVNTRVAANFCYMGKQRIFETAVLDEWMKRMVRSSTLKSFATQTPVFQELKNDRLTPECIQDRHRYRWIKYVVAIAMSIFVLTLRFTARATRAITLVNLLSAVCLIATMKILFRTWPYPLAATGLGFVAIATGLQSVPRAKISLYQTCVMSTLAAVSVVGANSSLRYNAVGTYELLKAIALPASVVINKTLTKEPETWVRLTLAAATFIFILIGTAAHPYQTSVPGLTWGILGACSSATEKSYVRTCKKNKDIDPVQLLKTTIPHSAVMIWMASMATESPRWYTATTTELLLLLIMCLLVVVVASTGHSICGSAGPVTYMCLATAKTFAAVALFNSWGTVTNTVGIVGSACTGALYIWNKKSATEALNFKRLPSNNVACE